MSNINHYIANASGSMDHMVSDIESAFTKAKKQVVKDFNLDEVDVIFVDAPYSAIPELGVGGYTPGPNIVYINLDPAFKFKGDEIFSTLLHEFHHACRWRNPGYGETLWQALVTEGLACLYEEQISDTKPIYVKNDDTSLDLLKQLDLNDKNYNHHEVFITGNDELSRWYGYFAGYEIAKKLLDKHTLDSISAVDKEFKFKEDTLEFIG